MDILAQYLPEIVLSLISAGLLGFCKYLHSQLKYFKTLNEEKSQSELIKTIQSEIEPIEQEIHALNTRIDEVENKESADIGAILTSYRFRLISLCKRYLRQEYLTQTQYDQISEFFKVYSSLGGNGQAKTYYDKVMELPIHEEK